MNVFCRPGSRLLVEITGSVLLLLVSSTLFMVDSTSIIFLLLLPFSTDITFSSRRLIGGDLPLPSLSKLHTGLTGRSRSVLRKFVEYLRYFRLTSNLEQ